MKKYTSDYLSLSVIALWFLLVGAGWLVMAGYESRPGETGETLGLPSQWQETGDSTQLFVFLHPGCPCSQATVEQLNRLLSRHPSDSATAFFFCPATEDESWIETSLWKSARRIPGLKIHTDYDAKIAREFGVVTSGHVLVYAGDGQPVFSGGITPGRGHQGSCFGTDYVRMALQGELLEASEGPVYGCRLYEGL